MKKIILSLFIVISLMSCKKTRTCECPGIPGSTSNSSTSFEIENNRTERDKCKAIQFTDAYGKVYASCKVK